MEKLFAVLNTDTIELTHLLEEPELLSENAPHLLKQTDTNTKVQELSQEQALQILKLANNQDLLTRIKILFRLI